MATLTLRVATVVALALTVGLGAVSNLLFLAAFQLRLEWFADPALAVAGGPASAGLFRWAALTDLFSYYLPTAVTALAVWVALRERSELLAGAGLVAALGYVLAGGTGAAALAMAGAPLIEAYAEPGADRAAIAATFRAMTEVVFRAVWQLIDGVLLTVWSVTTGLLVRPIQPGFGRLGLAVGAVFGVLTALNVLGLGLLRDLGLGLAFILWVTWFVWLAVLVWRRQAPFERLDRPGPGAP